MLELSNFNDYFGAFAALNFAYAGIEQFRDIIDKDILKIQVNINPEIEKAKNEAESKKIIAEVEFYSQEETLVRQRKLDIINSYEKKLAEIQKLADDDLSFPDTFKAMFFFELLHCLVLMVLSGYQKLMTPDIFNYYIFFLNFAFVFNLIIFIRSIIKSQSKNVRPFITAMCIFVLNILILFSSKLQPVVDLVCKNFSLARNIGFNLFAVTSPFLLLFLRVYIHKFYYRQKIKNCDNNCKSSLNQLDAAARFILGPFH